MGNEATQRRVTLRHRGYVDTKGGHIRKAMARDGHAIAIRGGRRRRAGTEKTTCGEGSVGSDKDKGV